MRNEELMVKHMPLARTLARIRKKKTLPMHVEIADLESEAMIALVQAGERFSSEGGASFKNYVGLRIAGRLLDYLERPDMQWDMRESLEDVHPLACALETYGFLARAVATLPLRWQRVLQLHYQSGLEIKEIGALLGLTEWRVYQLRREACDRLRYYLTRRGVESVTDVL